MNTKDNAECKATLEYIDTDYRYGFHVPKAKTLEATVCMVGKNFPFGNFQVYIANPRSASKKVDCDLEDVLRARDALKYYNLKMFIHGCLLYNLCGAAKHRKDPKFNIKLKNTCDGLVSELDVAVGLDCGGVVVHPNSCHDEEKGLFTASKTIENVLTRNTVFSSKCARKLGITQEEFKSRRCVILENSAHEGGKRGWNLQELSAMIKGVPKNLQKQIGVCIDTAHAFGAGIYDFGDSEEVHRFYRDFEKEIGLKHLKVFHLNDSKCSTDKRNNAPFGSRKDRHDNLCTGYIFGDEHGTPLSSGEPRYEGLRTFFLEARKRGIPIIGEPPASSLGGRFDWEIAGTLLANTEFPLVS